MLDTLKVSNFILWNGYFDSTSENSRFELIMKNNSCFKNENGVMEVKRIKFKSTLRLLFLIVILYLNEIQLTNAQSVTSISFKTKSLDFGSHCLIANKYLLADDGCSYWLYKNEIEEIVVAKINTCLQQEWAIKLGGIKGDFPNVEPFEKIELTVTENGWCYVVSQSFIEQPNSGKGAYSRTSRLICYGIDAFGKLRWTKVSNFKRDIIERNVLNLISTVNDRAIITYKMLSQDRDNMYIQLGIIGLDSNGFYANKTYTFTDSSTMTNYGGDLSFVFDNKKNTMHVFDRFSHNLNSWYKYEIDIENLNVIRSYAIIKEFDSFVAGSFKNIGLENDCIWFLNGYLTLDQWFGYFLFNPTLDSFHIYKYDLKGSLFKAGSDLKGNNGKFYGSMFNKTTTEQYTYQLIDGYKLQEGTEKHRSSAKNEYLEYSVNRTGNLLAGETKYGVTEEYCFNKLNMFYYDNSTTKNSCLNEVEFDFGKPQKESFKFNRSSFKLIKTFTVPFKDTVVKSKRINLDAQIVCSSRSNLAFANLGGDTAVCEPFKLSASTISTINASYLWNTGDTTFSIQIDSAGEYSVIINNGFCTSYDTINISFNDRIEFSAKTDSVICNHDSLALFASENFPYALVYTLPSNEKITKNVGDTFYAKLPGAYQVQSTQKGNCNFSYDFNLLKSNVFANAGNDTTLCAGSSYTLLGKGAGNPVWQPSDLLNNENDYNPIWTNVKDTFFELLVTDIYGCKAFDTVIFKTFSLPKAINKNGIFEFCDADMVKLELKVIDGKPPYYLALNQGLDSHTGDFEVTYRPKSDNDTLKILIKDSCQIKVSLTRIFNQHNSGFQHLIIEPNDSNKIGTQITLRSNIGKELKYSLNGSENIITKEHHFTGNDTGFYVMKISSTDSVCKSDTLIKFWFYKVEWFLPNAFTPATSYLINDDWKAFCANCEFKSIYIFNKGGQKIFETTNGQSWDGTFKGNLVPSGEYFFIAKAIDLEGAEINLSGNIIVLK